MQGIGKAIRSYWIPLLMVLCVLPMQVFGATGQIKGQITDKETKEPVIGASVQVTGTTMGGMTDADGRYQILRVEIGTYELTISHIDYDKVQVTGLVVNDGLTTEENIALVKKVTDIGKTITVTAAIPVIERYATENSQTLTSREIQARPVQSVDALLESVAGVQTNSTGEVFVRGGRAGEVSYIVDGVEIGDAIGGAGSAGANLSLVSGSIQEIQIIKDGFDPEYGNALSGIVNITTNTGSKDNTRINFQYLTDDLGSSDLNTYSRNYDYARFSISGPDPLLKSKILPALGLNFLAEKEFTYYFYGELSRDDDIYQLQDYDTPVTRRGEKSFNLFGLDIPERARNSSYWMANFKFRPQQNLKFIMSYKNSSRKNVRLYGNWDYRYSSATIPVERDDWQSLSLEMSQSLSKNTTYELHLSYYGQEISVKPGDPNNPGYTLDPDDFTLDSDWESYTDRNDNGVYDAPEPLINLIPDSANYGTNYTGAAYTSGEGDTLNNVQGGEAYISEFRFNKNGIVDNLEGEPFVDVNGNGVWDAGDLLQDKNGNGILDLDRVSNIDNSTPESYEDGDIIIGEPFTDINRNGVYDRGIDIFVKSNNDAINQDYNHNGQYDGPDGTWEPGIPFIDRNGNGLYDPPNLRYDQGEAFTDVNGNGTYDYGGSSTFFDPMTYDQESYWAVRNTIATVVS